MWIDAWNDAKSLKCSSEREGKSIGMQEREENCRSQGYPRLPFDHTRTMRRKPKSQP